MPKTCKRENYATRMIAALVDPFIFGSIFYRWTNIKCISKAKQKWEIEVITADPEFDANAIITLLCSRLVLKWNVDSLNCHRSIFRNSVKSSTFLLKFKSERLWFENLVFLSNILSLPQDIKHLMVVFFSFLGLIRGSYASQRALINNDHVDGRSKLLSFFIMTHNSHGSSPN